MKKFLLFISAICVAFALNINVSVDNDESSNFSLSSFDSFLSSPEVVASCSAFVGPAAPGISWARIDTYLNDNYIGSDCFDPGGYGCGVVCN